MNKAEVCARIVEIGIIPAVRASSAEDARFAAEAVSAAGIPIVEITMTVPGAIDVISYLIKHVPGMIVGAGSVLDVETARQCLEAGANFLTSDGLDLNVVELAAKEGSAVLPGALTPTEVITAWKAGADFVKLVPCAQVGGESYVRAVKAMLPQALLVAAGGVNQVTAANFILAGATALGVGTELIPKNAIRLREAARIRVLAHRFLGYVKSARAQMAPQKETAVAKSDSKPRK
ncbi:MAG: bifunctional 4-hydroxy-2-oxoglutarate aldolase/2-dehydro-3-deoxy-phosphogluconate aldolase [Candidatus Acidiferrales bacterium]